MFGIAENFVRLIQHPLFNLLFAMVALWSVGILFERFKLPLIIGELLAPALPPYLLKKFKIKAVKE